jgi:hypothetical protein
MPKESRSVPLAEIESPTGKHQGFQSRIDGSGGRGGEEKGQGGEVQRGMRRGEVRARRHNRFNTLSAAKTLNNKEKKDTRIKFGKLWRCAYLHMDPKFKV